MDKITVEGGAEDGFEVIKQISQKYIDMGYRRIDVKTSVNEKGNPVVEVIPSEFNPESNVAVTPAFEMPKILLGDNTTAEDKETLNSKLYFNSEDIIDYKVYGDANMITIKLKVGSIVRDKISGKAYVIKDSTKQSVVKNVLPKDKAYLTKLDEELADAKAKKLKADVEMKDAVLVEVD